MHYQTKQDQVAEVLREQIIAGVYERGQKLKQADLAEELGVSVTPVREALRILEAEGYVLGLSHRGVLVPPFNVEQAKELFELRMSLELSLTAHALPNLTDDKLQELYALQDVYAESTKKLDRNELRTANYRLHFRLYELARRPQTLQFVRVLWAKYPFHYLDAIESRTARAVREHIVFLECLKNGDQSGALEAMEVHIRCGWEEFSSCQVAELADPVYDSQENSR